MMRHKRVSCSPSNLAALAIGIALASVSTMASNNSVKPGTRSRPRSGDLVHPALRTRHPRHARVQQGAMLEEIEMPPGLVIRIVNRAAFAPALRASESAAARKIHVQIEPTILRVEFAARHRPRRRKTQGLAGKDRCLASLPSKVPFSRRGSPTHPPKPPYPLLSARSLICATTTLHARIYRTPPTRPVRSAHRPVAGCIYRAR